jgi:hypothetical protein
MSSVKLPLGMHEAYGETHFRISEHVDQWPQEFAIITAYATTGEVWSDAENEAADRALYAELCRQSQMIRRITGYSPSTGHAEPGGLSLSHSTPLARSDSATDRMPSISSAGTFSQ